MLPESAPLQKFPPAEELDKPGVRLCGGWQSDGAASISGVGVGSWPSLTWGRGGSRRKGRAPETRSHL